MKKILSLVLAVLMLATLAISASATTITNPFKNDRKDQILSDLWDYYKWYYIWSDELQDTVVPQETAWYETCGKCGNITIYFVYDNKVVWKCINSSCGDSGSVPVIVTPDGGNSMIDPSETAVCPNCNISVHSVYIATTVSEGKLVDRFLCGKCNKSYTLPSVFEGIYDIPNYENPSCGGCHKPTCKICHNYMTCKKCKPHKPNCGNLGCGTCYPDIIDPGFSYPTYPSYPSLPNFGDFKYTCPACFKDLELDYYSNINGTYYGFYKCADGHIYTLPYYGATNKPITLPQGTYRVNVICSTGGYYTISDNTAYGKYGEKKLINLYAYDGYVLTNVTVNGNSVGAKENLLVTIKGTTVIKAFYEKVSTAEQYAITVQTNGNGSVTAYKNGNLLTSATAVKGSKADSITYKFVPKSENYYVSDVKIDGKSVGAVSSYTFKNLAANHTIAVEFSWKSPYNFIAPAYAAAVEYVTETGIMAPTKVEKKVAYFSGTSGVTLKEFASALAEMCDVKDELKNDADRAYWALKNGLLLATDDENAIINVQTACRIIDAYLELVEKNNNVDFVDFNAEATPLENGISIKLVNEASYNGNRNLTRYDLAAICYHIKGLTFSAK